MLQNNFEILAPAGSLETLICAVNNGADAVYIGGQSFSARKNAVNFTNDEIISAIRYAHLYDCKVYVTVNTLIGDGEFGELFDFVTFLYEAGVDALIIQDLGVVHFVRKYFPLFPIHASTQMTIHNIEGARFAKKLGFSRVVLARELTFGEIKTISTNVDIELEVFVHGALCMCYSGQCLMSSFIGGRSGNRGACAQPCRLPYTLLDGNKEILSQKDRYLMSLKDLCLIEDMNALADCNVKSLKIEGRMKSSEYVSIVTSIYDKYRNGGRVSSEDISCLENIFSRNGFTKSYLYGDTGRHMLNYSESNDKVYRNIKRDVHDIASELKQKTPPRIPVHLSARLSMDRPMELTLSAKDKTVTLFGQASAQRAISVALDVQRVRSQLTKLGNTPFEASDVIIDLDENISIPIREINELRRMGIQKLQEAIAALDRIPCGDKSELPLADTVRMSKVSCNAQVRTMVQFDILAKEGVDKILVPYSLYLKNKEYIDTSKTSIAVILPPISRDIFDFDWSILPDEIYASNISQLSIDNRVVNADYTLNIYNSSAVLFARDVGSKSVCLSPELSINSIKSLKPYLPLEIIVYGRIPLMTVQNCIVKSAFDKCSCQDGYYLLRDRKGVCFPLFAEKGSCTNTIYNALPVYMADRLSELACDGIGAHRFIFTTETQEQIVDIIKRYRNGERADFDFTRGHFYRGV